MASGNFLAIVAIALVAGAVGAGVTVLVNEREEGGEERDEAVAPERTDTSIAATGMARISEDSARVLVAALVPGGRVPSVELENEGGKVFYSFDVTVPGKAGVEELHISALNGEVLSREHESESEEAAEKSKDSVGKGRKG